MKRALWAAATLIAVPLLAQTPPLTLGDYAYDGAGNIKHIGNDVYVYDRVSRLLSGGAGPGHSQAYTYDAYGNITRIVTDGNTGAPRIPGVDPLTNRMSINTGGATTFGAYDAAGRMTAYTGSSMYSFTYDGADMVRELTSSAGREVYVYTADDERIAVASLDNAGAVSSWHWSLRGLDNRVLRQIDQTAGTWSWKEDFIYGGDQLIAAELPAPTRTLHFFPDHLGTPRLITGNGGATIAKHAYYPFGEEVPPAPQDGQAMKFTGHERDFSGLDYMHARFYAAGAGRFLSVDPLGGDPAVPRSWNRYAYVLNRPVNLSDPTGKRWYDDTATDPFGRPRHCTLCDEPDPDPRTDFCFICPTASETITVTAKHPDPASRQGPSFLDHVEDLLGASNLKRAFMGDRPGQLFLGLGKELAWALGGEVLGAGETDFITLELSGRSAANLEEVLALDEAMAGAGKRIMKGKITDPRYPENAFAKMQHVKVLSTGAKIVIHYWEELSTGVRFGFKFK